MAVKLFIGVPCHAEMKIQTALSLALAVKALPYDMVLSAQKGPYTHWNRERIVEQAIEAQCSHLMFIDTDVSFPPDAIERLLSLGKPIVGANYNLKALPVVNTVRLADQDGNPAIVGNESLPKHPFRCYAVATGFMLIDLAAIADLERPLFVCQHPFGEDVYFCREAGKAGVEVWCDPTIQVDHFGEYAY